MKGVGGSGKPYPRVLTVGTLGHCICPPAGPRSTVPVPPSQGVKHTPFTSRPEAQPGAARLTAPLTGSQRARGGRPGWGAQLCVGVHGGGRLSQGGAKMDGGTGLIPTLLGLTPKRNGRFPPFSWQPSLPPFSFLPSFLPSSPLGSPFIVFICAC